MTDSEDAVWDELSGIPPDPPVMRDKCGACKRPHSVCWCPFLPQTTIQTRSRVVILQHPAEEKRCLRTVPMLELALSPGQCNVYKGKKFPLSKHNGLEELLRASNTLVLYPSKDSVPIEDIPKVDDNSEPYNLVVIDGTWAQAKSMYHNSPLLHNCIQIKLPMKGESEYIIRTQPNEGCLSTVEAVAEALGILEGRHRLRHELLQPLQALCRFQIWHGAVPHQSKKTLLDIGEYKKPIGKRTRKKLYSLVDIPSVTDCKGKEPS
ncbi:tRNA-uridine aminocarboxypropyltransferase 2 [Neocloeon triangulifer]|uniref:tRNA-uridine aminocarboxypropyltransferase 2 n=1 Tax=Neocloeon triangulifer TaxID=2078957 RepID=UPI00286ECA8F|nr:tRNA-uridine aminocarboxypropyltransferase 2 [Neocloeon triangulifer]